MKGDLSLIQNGSINRDNPIQLQMITGSKAQFSTRANSIGISPTGYNAFKRKKKRTAQSVSRNMGNQTKTMMPVQQSPLSMNAQAF